MRAFYLFMFGLAPGGPQRRGQERCIAMISHFAWRWRFRYGTHEYRNSHVKERCGLKNVVTRVEDMSR
ncbi:hypothetical protein EVAR_49580_1 [Eumeta japonica]|uniref:Uncharacterized protein n=1 Tax=Eumeta variegata TaxID=151549 RepID=A0A4C1YQX1_EUMVA|nr:hypothetical protein EVAR_49580_1 [Eumeta japonica]